VSDDQVFVDANIPMYAAGAEHPLKGPCLAILEWAAKNPLVVVTDVEVLQEILHRYSAIGQRDRAVDVAILFSRAVPEALPVTKQSILHAIELWQNHPNLQARDAVHAAVMEQHGVRRIVSADRHFDGLPGLTRIEPLDWANAASREVPHPH
jgi:predicted nucleic acid-binding protein